MTPCGAQGSRTTRLKNKSLSALEDVVRIHTLPDIFRNCNAPPVLPHALRLLACSESMSSVFNSDSTRSTRYGGADSQMTHNSHHSDNTSFDYLGENVLAATNGISRPPIPRPPPVPIHNFVDRSKVAEPASEHTGNTRLVIAIDYGTTFTGKTSQYHQISTV